MKRVLNRGPFLVVFLLGMHIFGTNSNEAHEAHPTLPAITADAAAADNEQQAKEPTLAEKADESKSESSTAASAKSNDKGNGENKKKDKSNTKGAEEGADKSKAKEDAKTSGEKPAKAEGKQEKAKAERKTHKVEQKRLRIDHVVDGTFVAGKMTEVPLRPDSWTDYEIVEVVPLGTRVRKGETLFKFDAKKINEAIDDMELEMRLNELAIARAEEELPRLERTLKMDFEGANRSDREAREDHKRYNEIDRPMMVKSAEFMLKYYKSNLEYEQDELDQLEKMYKADDLTEETEEIVLKRQRDAVERAKFSLESAKVNREETLSVQLPRMDVRIKESLERSAMAKARAQMALSLDLSRMRYEQEQRKKARVKSLERHTKLLADRERMEIKSPGDGVVYYGPCANGSFGDQTALEKQYQPHNRVSGGSVLMTIVEGRPLTITSTLEESKRGEVSTGMAVKVALPAEDAERLAGKVESISSIPVSAGKFEVQFDLAEDKLPSWLVAGMGCKVSLTTYNKADAIVVPKQAIHDDEDDPDQHYVWLVDADEADDADAKPKRRSVKLGKRKGDNVEILKGLKKGDVVSLDDEEQKAKDKEKEKEKKKE